MEGKMYNNRLHSDKIMLHSFLTSLHFAGEAKRSHTQFTNNNAS